MQLNWPDTEYSARIEMQDKPLYKSADDFRTWLRASPGLVENCAEEAFSAGYHENKENLVALVTLKAQGKLSIDDTHIFLTLVCAYLLQISPDISTWKIIRAVGTWSVETWLGQAMMGLCKVYPSFSNNYVNLIKDIIHAVEANNLRSQSERGEKERNDLLTQWAQHTNRLEEIWRGFRNFNSLSMQESRFLPVLAEIAPSEFTALLANSQDPYIVLTALDLSGAGHHSPQLSFWSSLMEVAPAAFSDSGEWNGAILLPLLLTHIQSRLDELPNKMREFELSDDQLKDEYARLTAFLGKSIGDRSDAAGIVTRWGAWLMRSYIQWEILNPTPKQPAFLYGLMVDALGRNTTGVDLPDTSPQESAVWEEMSYFALRASFSHNGYREALPREIFENVWNAKKCSDHYSAIQAAMSKLSLYVVRTEKEFPGLAAYAFASTITEPGQTADRWISMWQSSYFMREIAEFGSPESESDNYSDRTDSGQLMLILCRTGIAAIDLLVNLGSENNRAAVDDARCLFTHLISAVKEMLILDDTSNKQYWKKALRILCLMRLLWDKSVIEQPACDMFSKEHLPDFTMILNYYKAESTDLSLLLSECLSVGISVRTVSSAVAAADINLRDLISKLRYLHSLSEKKYPVNGKILRSLESLIECG